MRISHCNYRRKPYDEPTSINGLPKCIADEIRRAWKPRTSAAGRPRRAVEIRGLPARNRNKISARRRFPFAVVVRGSAHVLSRARAIKRARTLTIRSRRDGVRRHRQRNSRSSDPNATAQRWKALSICHAWMRTTIALRAREGTKCSRNHKGAAMTAPQNSN